MRIPIRSKLSFRIIATTCLLVVFSISSQAQKTPDIQQITQQLKSGDRPTRIVCFGDSITGVYYHSGSARAWTDMLGIALQQAYPEAKLEMINAGISGHTTVNALARIQKDVITKKPDLVVIMFGMNDVTRIKIENYEKNLRDITQQCLAAGAAVILCSANSVYENPTRPNAKLAAYAKRVEKIASELKLPYVDFFQDWSDLDKKDHTAWMLLMSETIHPNLNGHKRFAERITHSLSGKKISLADIESSPDPLQNTLQLLHANQPIKLVAMPPYDQLVPTALKKKFPQAKIEVTSWPVANQSLAQIRMWSQKIRKMSPTLVIIDLPASILSQGSDSDFIRDYQWVLNNSFHFGKRQWDVLALLPTKKNIAPQRLQLIRQLIIGKDLSPLKQLPNELIDR